MGKKKIVLKLSECIIRGDSNRLDRNQPPIRSMRGLAKELEYHWPERYDSNYIKSRLHRANKDGITKPPPTLINDILTLLYVTEEELVKLNTLKR